MTNNDNSIKQWDLPTQTEDIVTFDKEKELKRQFVIQWNSWIEAKNSTFLTDSKKARERRIFVNFIQSLQVEGFVMNSRGNPLDDTFEFQVKDSWLNFDSATKIPENTFATLMKKVF